MSHESKRRITRLPYAALLAVAVVASASAQSQTPPDQAASARFEVASIKANNGGGIMVRFPPGGPDGYRIVNVSLYDLIVTTLRIRPFQLVNAPDWTRDARFDITAKGPEGVALTPPVVDTMVRTLLAERFKLATHREMREQPTYALVLAAAGGSVPPGLEPAQPECLPGGRWLGPGPDGRPLPLQPGQRRSCTTTGIPGGGIAAGSMTMAGLAATVAAQVGRLVQDRTGLEGRFQFELKFVSQLAANVGGNAPPPGAPVVDSAAPSLVTALQEQLGLKLESTRGPVEVFVIDAIDRPTPD
jgi:uncharacterized protein (TIGR03435 family)